MEQQLDSLPADVKNNLLRLFEQRHFDVLLKQIHAALKVYPRNPFAWNLAGETFRKVGRIREAITAFEKVIQLTPDYYGAYNNEVPLVS
jgi:tetratricopeptide (TPR) repeat protein